MAGIVRVHYPMTDVQLSEVTHPLWACGIEHQVSVHAANLESVDDGAVAAEVFINTRQFALGHCVFIQVHREHSPSGRTAKRGVEDVVVKDHQISRTRVSTATAPGISDGRSPHKSCASLGWMFTRTPKGIGAMATGKHAKASGVAVSAGQGRTPF